MSPRLEVATVAMAASAILFASLAKDLYRQPIRKLLQSSYKKLQNQFSPQPQILTIVIEELDSHSVTNQMFQAALTYLDSIFETKRIKVNIPKNEKEFSDIIDDKDQELIHTFLGINFKWVLVSRSDSRSLELSFRSSLRPFVLNTYLPYIRRRAKAIKDKNEKEKKTVMLHIVEKNGNWGSINFNDPATFDTIKDFSNNGFYSNLKNTIMDSLDGFIAKKDFRGPYTLLYGPPGSEKSSLVAAMANYLQFDVYDLDLKKVQRSKLGSLLAKIARCSIILVQGIGPSAEDGKATISDVLQFIDTKWALAGGGYRIIVFSADNKEQIDPMLLKPGRVDVHLHKANSNFMGYYQLASKEVFGIIENLFGRMENRIEKLLLEVKITTSQALEKLKETFPPLVSNHNNYGNKWRIQKVGNRIQLVSKYIVVEVGNNCRIREVGNRIQLVSNNVVIEV